MILSDTKEYLTFQDVLLKPRYSEIRSRSEVSLDVNLPKGFTFKSPVIPANMESLVGKDMIKSMYKLGALSLMHRFSSFENQIELIIQLKKELGDDILNYLGVSIGVKDQDLKNLNTFSTLGIKIICIDIAHLDSVQGLYVINQVSKAYPDKLLIAGNVATGEAAARAWSSGADIVKVGIGSSGICSTRMVAGAGVPQLSALDDVKNAQKTMEKDLKRKLHFISDGGHSIVADCVKSLCFASMIMLGGMLAGTDETPSPTLELNGMKLKAYNGSSTHKGARVEGVNATVLSKGPVADIMTKIHEGIQSGCSYQNCKDLETLKVNPNFIRITHSGIKESGIHDVVSSNKVI